MKTKENKDEIRAQHYLQTLKQTNLQYEPLGNVTPDFLMDNTIAIEVRRLNRNFINSKHKINIENVDISVIKNIKKTIEKFTHKYYKNSAYISISLIKSIDIEKRINIIRRVKKILKKHTNHISRNISYKIGDYLKLTFIPTDKRASIYSYSGCNNDFFWILHQLKKSIQLVIDEKDKKVTKNFHFYNEWWLILVDSITYSLDNEDFEKLKNIQIDKRKFHKVIILSPKGKFKTVEF
jgi:type II secretory pathway component GspD/PulD (secretin)